MQVANDRGASGRHFPLHVHVGSLAIALIVLTGAILGWFNYVQSSRIILASADRIFDDLTREISADLAAGSRLNHTTIELLARSGLGEASSLEERLALLPMLQGALAHNDRLYSVYAGYDDGAFFQLVPLRTESRRAFFEAPEQAAYVAWSVDAAERGARSTYRFLGPDLRLIAERPYEGPPYDPRKRPWYSAARASDRLTVTDPYVFFVQREVGATVARRGTGDAGVVAGDVTLAQLSDILAQIGRAHV